MYNNKIAEKIKKILKENKDKTFKIREIAQLVHSKKHEYKSLNDTLREMARKKIIKRIDKRFSYLEKTNFESLEGKFDATPLARNFSFAFVITESFDVFIDAEDTLNAYHNDIVLIEIKYRKGKRRYGIIKKILKRYRTKFVGNVISYKNNFFISFGPSKIHTDFLILNKDIAKAGDKVEFEISNWGNKDLGKLPAGNIISVLGKAGEPEVEVLGVIKQFNLPLEFHEKVIKESVALPHFISDIDLKNRKDLRNLLTFTIDPASAKDFDDAISLVKKENKLILYVHIADVANYVKIDSEIFKEACKRGNSFYFPKKVIPMLPEIISNKLCSLRPLEEKLTQTVQIEFNQEYKIISKKVYNSIIISDLRLTYEEVDLLFDEQKSDIPLNIATTLFEMKNLSKKLSLQREKKGSLNFYLPEVQYEFDDVGHLQNLKRSKETESHSLIENFMLLANEYVATLLSKKMTSTIFRVHNSPEEEELDQIFKLLKTYNIEVNKMNNYQKTLQTILSNTNDMNFHRVFDRIILRSMKKAKYSTENTGHFGLAIQNYTHFTSPIRRICDLIVHHQLKSIYEKKNKTIFSFTELRRYAGFGSMQEILADESEREITKLFLLEFMKKKIGQVFTGLITNINNSTIFIELDEYPVTGLIKIANMQNDYFEYYQRERKIISNYSGKLFQLMDSVEVKVVRVEDDVFLEFEKK